MYFHKDECVQRLFQIAIAGNDSFASINDYFQNIYNHSQSSKPNSKFLLAQDKKLVKLLADNSADENLLIEVWARLMQTINQYAFGTLTPALEVKGLDRADQKQLQSIKLKYEQRLQAFLRAQLQQSVNASADRIREVISTFAEKKEPIHSCDMVILCQGMRKLMATEAKYLLFAKLQLALVEDIFKIHSSVSYYSDGSENVVNRFFSLIYHGAQRGLFNLMIGDPQEMNNKARAVDNVALVSLLHLSEAVKNDDLHRIAELKDLFNKANIKTILEQQLLELGIGFTKTVANQFHMVNAV